MSPLWMLYNFGLFVRYSVTHTMSLTQANARHDVCVVILEHSISGTHFLPFFPFLYIFLLAALFVLFPSTGSRAVHTGCWTILSCYFNIAKKLVIYSKPLRHDIAIVRLSVYVCVSVGTRLFTSFPFCVSHTFVVLVVAFFPLCRAVTYRAINSGKCINITGKEKIEIKL